MRAKFSDSRNYDDSSKILLERAKTALEICGFKIHKSDGESGTILAKAKISLWSWGENLKIHVHHSGTVEMKSECAMQFQIYDWEKNKTNLDKFFHAFDFVSN